MHSDCRREFLARWKRWISSSIFRTRRGAEGGGGRKGGEVQTTLLLSYYGRGGWGVLGVQDKTNNQNSDKLKPRFLQRVIEFYVVPYVNRLLESCEGRNVALPKCPINTLHGTVLPWNLTFAT
jgi:hypothetical protein